MLVQEIRSLLLGKTVLFQRANTGRLQDEEQTYSAKESENAKKDAKDISKMLKKTHTDNKLVDEHQFSKTPTPQNQIKKKHFPNKTKTNDNK